ncbi:hypothetical protein [Psychromonas sp.]|uniref:hypothetical protein n=1 Tax=Psychromonas sp. TaxID=1884585 RepID=UPI00356A7373
MRMIKSAEEIELIKHGVRTADIGGAACTAGIAENVQEFEVALAENAAMTREIASTFPHIYPCYFKMLCQARARRPEQDAT